MPHFEWIAPPVWHSAWHQEDPLGPVVSPMGNKRNPRRISSFPNIAGGFPGGPLGSLLMKIIGEICWAWPLRIKYKQRNGAGLIATSAQILTDCMLLHICTPVKMPASSSAHLLVVLSGQGTQWAVLPDLESSAKEFTSLGDCSMALLKHGSKFAAPPKCPV